MRVERTTAPEAVTSLPIRYADGAVVEDHGSSIWAICYVRREIDGEIVLQQTEAVVFQRDDFMRSLMGAIGKLLPAGIMNLVRPREH